MLRHTSLLVIFAFAIAFTSCNKLPEHARYIPKDAVAVVGVNTKELSKKLAWNALMGSKLLDEMKAKNPENSAAAEGLGDAGIDPLNTSFLYYTPEKDGYNYLTILIPLSDAKKWEPYVQKNFSASVKEVNKHKEALLEEGLYAAWDDKLAIIRKVFSAPQYNTDMDNSFGEDSVIHTPVPAVPAAEKLSADMQEAFTIQKDKDITQDKRFCNLQTNGDDITVWINYEAFMKGMNNYSAGMMGGLSLGSSLWKDVAYGAGINLDKGAIHADIRYYLSEELMNVYAKAGNKNTDKDMIDRLPTQQANLLASATISPDGTKALLEKMGMLGFMSLALSQANLTADDVFQSFTGDMVATLSNFSVHPTADTAAYGNAKRDDVDMNFLFAMKINDKEKFNKLLGYVKEQGGLSAIDATTYQVGGNEGLFLSVDKGFMAIANKAGTAKDFINGVHKAQPKPEVVKKELYGHPMSAYIDIQSFLNNIVIPEQSAEQAEMLDESKKIFKDVIINGGENKKEAYTYHAVLNLMNKEENSLLQLLDYSYKINEIRKSHEKKTEPAVAAAPSGGESAAQN